VGLAALAGNAQVGLTWTASKGASSYQIKRATTGKPYTEVGTAASTSYTDTGLTNGTAYYYVVVAVNSAGQSAPSGEATATPEASSGCTTSAVIPP
jgi:cellulose 1,4-beta-cellobiosidase